MSSRRVCVRTMMVLMFCLGRSAGSQPSVSGWRYEPDAGAVYRRGDFRWTVWGFAERFWGPHSEIVSADSWRRVRQGMEFDLPRISHTLRPAVVYEVDLTDNNFFRNGRASQVFENLYVSLEHTEDESRVRVLFGENTHILSHEDNLSSGNLPTLNRSLILEEHGSVHSFGTQFGTELQLRLTPRLQIAVAAQDNRGSFNTDRPSYEVGNSLAVKLSAVVISDTTSRRQLAVGVGADYTRATGNGTFALASAIGGESLGGTSAAGDKLTLEGDMAVSGAARGHAVSMEFEGLFSDFSHSLTDVAGGYAQLQFSMVESARVGEIDPFVRFDIVRLDREQFAGVAVQRALRTGVNYNLPATSKHASVHIEYALNHVTGPANIVPATRDFGELRVELRINAVRYLRHP